MTSRRRLRRLFRRRRDVSPGQPAEPAGTQGETSAEPASVGASVPSEPAGEASIAPGNPQTGGGEGSETPPEAADSPVRDGDHGREVASGADADGDDASPPWEVVPAPRRPRPLTYGDGRGLVDGMRPPGGRRTFVGPLEAVFHHPFVTLLPVLLFVGGAVALGLQRRPTYTAESRLSLSLVDVTAQYLQQQVLGNQLLAVDYARAIDTPEVIRAASRSTRLTPRQVDTHLDASPIPSSSIIRVEAKTHSRATSIALANAGSRALTSYIGKVSLSTDDTRRLNQYRRAALRVSQLQSRVTRLQRSDASPAAIRQATAEAQTAFVNAESLANVYRVIQQNAPARNRAGLLTLAARARSDFSSVLQRLIIIGAVAGAALGVTFALARANRPILRRTRG